MREAARISAARSRQLLQSSMTQSTPGRRTSRAATVKSEQHPSNTDVTNTRQSILKTEEPIQDRKRKRGVERVSTKSSPTKKIKAEEIEAPEDNLISKPSRAPSLLKDRKLKAYAASAGQSPFPDFPHPTPAEAKIAHKILQKLHGSRVRPEKVVASHDRAGCGDSPSVLDALVRTILSQNTSDTNSSRAKRSMDAAYGGSDRWDAIVEGGQAKLEDAIRCGGLSQTKSKVIISILNQVHEKYGKYSLDHLFKATNEEAMQEMLSFQGVGPKTASCVLLFCLQRESFAVDTHVHRITGLLGWRPQKASRDETHAHLDVRIPDEDKYGLHILLVTHGKRCEECRAGGKNLGKCELRRAFRKSKLQGEAGEDIKEEEEKTIKVETKV